MKMSLGSLEEPVRARAALLAPELDRVWRRDASFWGGDAARQSSVANRLGWLDVVGLMQSRVEEIEAFSREVRDAGFRDAVVLGMGGSSLAPEVLRQSITDRSPGDAALRLHILDTTDPATILHVRERIDVAKTLFFVSSKSGTTLEALCLFAYFHRLVGDAKGSRAGENFVAITDAGTPLQDLATQHGFRRVFVNPGDIGGRYSALSYFGLVPSAVAGLDIRALLASATGAVANARTLSNDTALLGAALGELALHGRDKCTFLLSPTIASFGLWVEQLIAESTGKQGTGILPVVDEPLLDPSHYGADRCFVQLRVDGDDNMALDRHAAAVAEAGHPVITIDLRGAYELGREFFNWEFATAIVGQILGINPFDEPNVQESKDNTNRGLADLEATGAIAIDATSLGSSEETASLSSLGQALETAKYFAITSYTPASTGSERAFAAIRKAVGKHFDVPTTLGYGPRFLHSTGQFHKGGPQVGAFLQVLGDAGADGAGPPADISIPGKSYAFGQLKRAQAAGDRASLLRLGRPVVTIDLGSNNSTLNDLQAALQTALNE